MYRPTPALIAGLDRVVGISFDRVVSQRCSPKSLEISMSTDIGRCSPEPPKPAAMAWYPPLKVTAETIIAAVLLVLTGPLILALTVLVRLNSPGPGLYVQVRLGRGGRSYRIYKIRTMSHDCERGTGPRWSTPGDLACDSSRALAAADAPG